jgi:hypothetical protein
VKQTAPMVAAFLLFFSGCSKLDRVRPSSETEEVRHPSNEMTIPEPPPEPPRSEPRKAVAALKRPVTKPRRAPAFEDPRQIPAGIDYNEMVRRFGPPSMKITDSPSRTTFSYARLGTQVQVELQNGKVTSVAAVNTAVNTNF